MDPVCGLRVDPEHPVAASTYRARTYYFHSAACKAEFDAHPDQFVHSADVVPAGGTTEEPGDRYGAQRASIEATYLEHGAPPEEAHRNAEAIVEKLHRPRGRA